MYSLFKYMIMKNLFLFLLFGIAFNSSFSQNLPDYSSIKLEVKEDYNSVANNAALQAANYILATPVDKKNNDRLKSIVYVIKWMTGTPDYNFTLDEKYTKFAKKNDDLLMLYMVAMAKFVLENNTDSKDQNKIILNAVKLIVAYVKDSKNNVKINNELKKMIEADDNGKLSDYLKL